MLRSFDARCFCSDVRWAMAEPKKNDQQVTKDIDSDIDPDNTLLPMLIGGLVLIVIGAIIVMMFV